LLLLAGVTPTLPNKSFFWAAGQSCIKTPVAHASGVFSFPKQNT